MLAKIAIAPESLFLTARAENLAKKLALPIMSIDVVGYSMLLVVCADHLELRQIDDKSKPIFVDFLSPQLNYRKDSGCGQKQLLAKAIGIKSIFRPSVIDATAGFGIDSYILAVLGCKVLMLERSSIIGALLNDGLRRAKLNADFAKLDFQLKVTDSIKYLKSLSEAERPDVIYLDPMFPVRNKSALNKKALRVLGEIVGKDLDAEDLLQVALQVARRRVVIKRPRLAPSISNAVSPAIVFNGKSCRFDVYLLR